MVTCQQVINESEIQFGTSGARGLVEQFSSQVCAAFTVAFLSALKGRFDFERVSIGIDRRPSSPQMAAACAQAAEQLGFKVDYCGVLPTPALALHAMQNLQPAIMITGSHIPFDRNGIKFYRPDGEITKADEQAIVQSEALVSDVNDLKTLVVNNDAVDLYLQRYASLLPAGFLAGKRVGIYEHSSAGRDLYAQLFSQLGAEVVPLGRSEEFVPIDTEAVRQEDIEKGQAWSKEYKLDFLFSTDGDGDRPLMADEKGQWLRGDVLGLLTADYLGIEALAVPVSCNTAIEQSQKFKKVMRTRIGSPYVIEGMQTLQASFAKVAGFEANGGFLLGSNVALKSHTLTALPTRDALLPVLACMASAIVSGVTLSQLVAQLPPRYTASDRVQNFATTKSQALIAQWSNNPDIGLEKLGLADHTVASQDQTDGLRVTLDNGYVVHLRPSGNAPELRCYVEADSQQQAQNLVKSSLSGLASLK